MADTWHKSHTRLHVGHIRGYTWVTRSFRVTIFVFKINVFLKSKLSNGFLIVKTPGEDNGSEDTILKIGTKFTFIITVVQLSGLSVNYAEAFVQVTSPNQGNYAPTSYLLIRS